jgi:hypothetical protein
MSTPTTPAPLAPLTFEDVVQAIGDTDPASTNANKIRAALGRGSFATIQKHLDTIRAQRLQAAQPPEAGPVPPAPPELLSMWGAAVAVAVGQVRARLDGVVQERDTLSQALESSRGDVVALTTELEGSEARAEAADLALAAAVAQNGKDDQARNADLAAVRESHAAELAALRADLAESVHQVETVKLEAQLGAAALQATIDRLTDQVGELKSLLHAPDLAQKEKKSAQ